MYLQSRQLLFVQKLYHAPGQLHHAFALEIAEHPGDHFPMGSQVIGDGLMGDVQPAVLSMAASSRRKAATRRSMLFHMICSMSHMTSENRADMISLV